MTQIYDKSAVAQAFSKAAHTYDQHAAFQRDVGQRLMDSLPLDLTGWQVLDLGCGTGHFSYLLAQRGAKVIAVDISLPMLEVCRVRCQQQSVQYIQADAEHLPFSHQSFDLVFSNLALQWCQNIGVLLNQLSELLKPNGRMVWSTLLEGSLYELDFAWQKVAPQYCHVNRFHSLDELEQAMNEIKILRAKIQPTQVICWYTSALALMKDLKGIGATHGLDRNRGLTKPKMITDVEQIYQTFRASNGLVPATYQVGLGDMEK